MKDRILMVSEPGQYGVLFYLRDLVRHLHRRGIGVDLAYSSRRGSIELKGLVAEIKGRHGLAADMDVGHFPEPGDRRALRLLRRMVAERRHAVVHAHSSKAGVLVRTLGLLRLLPGSPSLLYSPHGYFGMSHHAGLLGRAEEAVFGTIEVFLGHLAPCRTHHVSSAEREFAIKTFHLSPRREILIYGGIDLQRFRPAEPWERLGLRRALGLPEEGRLLVTVGRNAYEKDYGDLYTALDRVLPHAEDCYFAHAGHGSPDLRATLRPEAAARAFAFPHLARPEDLLRAADGFVLPSRSEAFGLAAYEALGCGLPLILSASTGLLSLRRLGFPGIHWLPNPAEKGDISASIIGAIESWMASNEGPNLARRERAVHWFSESVQFDKLIRLYEHLEKTRRAERP